MALEATPRDPAASIASMPSLDGRVFDLVHSSASRVAAEPTRFAYHERDGVIWGDYEGDTVVLGRLHGTRQGDALEIAFVHRRVDGAMVRGEATSRIERDGDRLRLIESFVAPDGAASTSVCIETLAS